MEKYLREIVQVSFGSTPEDMLRTSLMACIELSAASGGSILGEEGPFLQFLFSDVEKLIGQRVPFDSIAGVTVKRGLVVYTYAPTDRRHFDGVDKQIARQTRYLLSIPIPSIHRGSESGPGSNNAGALQLLFDENILPGADVESGPQEFALADFKLHELYEKRMKSIFWILPLVAFGMEVMSLRQTSYQAIHELKNKMIAGLSWIDYLRQDLTAKAKPLLDDEDIREDLELSAASIREGADLAKTYLQLTKLYEPKFALTDLNDVLEETAASTGAVAAGMHADAFGLKLDLDRDIPKLELDAAQLKMAFFNLCKNAVEVLVQHPVDAPALMISTSRRGDRAEIVIEDNGPGMPQEIADNLFIPFKTKKEGGTGLGLTITKKILDIHGGSITCETGATGTRFIIHI